MPSVMPISRPLHGLLAAIPVLLVHAPAAQDRPALPQHARLGVFFWHDSDNDALTMRGIRDGMRQSGLELTWLERHAAADEARARALLAEIAAARCDLVFALGTQSALLVKDAIRDVPVVYAAVGNPVAAGVVPSWGSNAGNLCGASNWIPPQNVLDVFALAVPNLRRIGMLRSQASGVTSRAELATMQAHLASDPRQRIELVDAVAEDEGDIARAVRTLVQREVDALWIPIDISIYQHLDAVQQALGPHHLPLLTTAAAAMQTGAMVGTVADYPLHGRRAAAMALQILRGDKKPSDFAVNRMRGSLVVADLGAARRAGIELPLSLLVLADELVDAESGR